VEASTGVIAVALCRYAAAVMSGFARSLYRLNPSEPLLVLLLVLLLLVKLLVLVLCRSVGIFRQARRPCPWLDWGVAVEAAAVVVAVAVAPPSIGSAA
jgi:hypothetical protein